MKLTPTTTGGRVVEGDTPWGTFRVEWGPDDVMISENMDKRTPATLPGTAQRKRNGPGTFISNGLKRLGAKPCRGCNKRATWLDCQWAKLVCAWRCLSG